MIQDTLKQITLAPTKDLLSQLAYEIYEIGQQLVETAIMYNKNKEDLKMLEIDEDSRIRASSETKPTEKYIENQVRIATQEFRNKVQENGDNKERLYALLDGAKGVFEASKTRIILENKQV